MVSIYAWTKRRNTPRTRVGSGFRDWTLAVQSRKTAQKSEYKKMYSFLLCQNMRSNKISASWVSPMWVNTKERRRNKEEWKSVITMVSTYDWTKKKKKKKVSENTEAALIKRYIKRSVKTMASFASTEAARTKSQWKQWPGPLPSATTGGVRKPPGPKRKKSVKPMASFASTETNGQLCFQPSPTPWVLTMASYSPWTIFLT